MMKWSKSSSSTPMRLVSIMAEVLPGGAKIQPAIRGGERVLPSRRGGSRSRSCDLTVVQPARSSKQRGPALRPVWRPSCSDRLVAFQTSHFRFRPLCNPLQHHYGRHRPV